MEIGERIRLARKRLDLTQEDLASILGVTKAEVSRLEGSTRMWSDTVERVARALNMSVSELVSIGEEKAKNGRSKKRV